VRDDAQGATVGATFTVIFILIEGKLISNLMECRD
jgi:hypothetical protein